MVSEGVIRTKSHVSLTVQLAIVTALFLSLILLYGCAYYSVRQQLQQLRTEVDQLKAVAGYLGNDQINDGSSEVKRQLYRRSKRQINVNESAPHSHNDTIDEEEKAEDGSGEFTDHQYPGIWMGSYSRVPVS